MKHVASNASQMRGSGKTSARCSISNKEIEAVIVATPDHVHACAAMAAMK